VHFFGLPGNPLSGFACVLRLCSRLLTRLAGVAAADGFRTSPLATALGANGPREFYQPAIIEPDGKIRPLEWKSSADVYTLSTASALLVREANEPAVPAGAPARFLEIPE
jgi:molybdopterin molybdotransferase